MKNVLRHVKVLEMKTNTQNELFFKSDP